MRKSTSIRVNSDTAIKINSLKMLLGARSADSIIKIALDALIDTTRM